KLGIAADQFEILFVDDGSTVGSVEIARSLAAEVPAVTLIELQGNFGKSAALAAGFQRSRGRIVFTLDAGWQDDPMEIPRFVNGLNAGYDLACGCKRKRNDPWTKVIPSQIFNWMVRKGAGIHLHDVNCGCEAHRAEVV